MLFSSRMRLKLAIRESENSLIFAEKLAALALLNSKDYPIDPLDSLWRKMLFLAFHDVVPSCGIDEIYDEAWEYIDAIRQQAKEIADQSMLSLAKVQQK